MVESLITWKLCQSHTRCHVLSHQTQWCWYLRRNNHLYRQDQGGTGCTYHKTKWQRTVYYDFTLNRRWQYAGLPRRHSGKESTCQCRRHRFDPWSRKIPHAMEHLSPVPQALRLALELRDCNHWTHTLQLKPVCPRAHQQEKPPQWEALAMQQRRAPALCN